MFVVFTITTHKFLQYLDGINKLVFSMVPTNSSREHIFPYLLVETKIDFGYFMVALALLRYVMN